MNITYTDGNVTYVRIILVIKEVGMIDVDTLNGVIVKDNLAVLDVVSKLTLWDKRSIEFFSRILYRLCILVYLSVALKRKSYRGTIGNNLNDVYKFFDLIYFLLK